MKVNVIKWLEFEFIYNNVTVEHNSLYTMVIPSKTIDYQQIQVHFFF